MGSFGKWATGLWLIILKWDHLVSGLQDFDMLYMLQMGNAAVFYGMKANVNVAVQIYAQLSRLGSGRNIPYIFSDGCPIQNKNSTFITMMLHLMINS